MKIIFVRHGHPNYENDCLTELGHLHAKAAAQRLKNERIDRMFSSSCGRAVETAAHIAKVKGISDVKQFDFMREIDWGSVNGGPVFKDGHPWDTADNMVRNGVRVMDDEWINSEGYKNNMVVQCVGHVCEGFDMWLKELGYEREGQYYRVKKDNPENILLASHAGSSSAAIAHILNLPFPFVCASIKPDFTAVTVISFDGREGELITPSIELMNDARHIAGIEVQGI